jgi:hypothetical protein
VRCNPSAEVHADGGDFALAYPDTGEFGDTARLDAEIGQGIDEGFLDGAHVGAYVALPFAQVHDGVADDLAGAMIGDVAAAVGGVEGDAGAGEDVIASQQIFQVAVAAHGDGVGMLQQDELVGDGAGLTQGDELLLPIEGGGVFHAARFPPLALKH